MLTRTRVGDFFYWLYLELLKAHLFRATKIRAGEWKALGSNNTSITPHQQL